MRSRVFLTMMGAVAPLSVSLFSPSFAHADTVTGSVYSNVYNIPTTTTSNPTIVPPIVNNSTSVDSDTVTSSVYQPPITTTTTTTTNSVTQAVYQAVYQPPTPAILINVTTPQIVENNGMATGEAVITNTGTSAGTLTISCPVGLAVVAYIGDQVFSVSSTGTNTGILVNPNQSVAVKVEFLNLTANSTDVSVGFSLN